MHCKRVFRQFFYPPYQALQRIPSIPKHCDLINVIQTFLQKKHLIFHVCPSLGWSFYRVGVTTDPTLVINHPHHINQHVYHIFENFVGLLKGKFICIFAIWSLRMISSCAFSKSFSATALWVGTPFNIWWYTSMICWFFIKKRLCCTLSVEPLTKVVLIDNVGLPASPNLGRVAKTDNLPLFFFVYNI